MEEVALLAVCITMFLGSYVAGCLPLVFNLCERKIRLASVFGAGLLVGTALCVIIPEGISTLYESVNTPARISDVSGTGYKLPENAAFAKGPMNVKQKAEMAKAEPKGLEKRDLDETNIKEPKFAIPAVMDSKEQHSVAKREVPEVVQPQKDAAPQPRPPQQLDGQVLHEHDTEEGHNHASELPDFGRAIGVSLVIGFVFMFIIDQFSKSSQAGGRNKGTATLGLVIHAAADGIAMGSASTSTEAEIQIVVFIAIMLHKGPTAFALVSFLVMEGLEKTRVRKHLLIFSLAAPVGTLLTYITLHTVESTYLASPYITGVILLFSAGTFLYIAAAHVLPELMETKCSLISNNSGPTGRSHFSLFEVIIFVLAAMFPTMISSHGHAH
ncbi:ZIP zinc transporter domain-containing protein [Ditylenchus destructor]|nr:ZIP zinc transporter domain-containing protein [Ditylenchus destructor]